MERLRKDVRREAHFRRNPIQADGEIHYIKDLGYLKSDWEAPICFDGEIEEALDRFEATLRDARRNYNRIHPSNILPHQWHLIEDLKDNDDFIVVEADKNCGGCILLRDTYITRGISEHLGNRTVYRPLTESQAKRHLTKLKRDVICFATKWRARRAITKAEKIFLDRAVERFSNKFSRFRMSLKAHKTPWKMRPIVACVGTFMNYLSCWLDYHLQKLKPLIKTYIKDSKELLTKLHELGALPSNARIFTADANSMYTNIDTDHAIEVITAWLTNLSNTHQLPYGYPLPAVLEAMELVMRNNIFEWGDLYFLQLLGTAMGTSAACMWATIYFAIHEMGTLIPTYERQLLLFLRFIDDMIGIWTGTDEEYKQFQKDTDNFGILTWEFEELSSSVDFLDLTITIENGAITTKTYQKSINLYQYIPPYSAHPKNMIKGILYSLLRTYYIQNTKTSDYLDIVTLLYKRHVARGWDRATIKRLILDADLRVREKEKEKELQPTPTNLPTDTPTNQPTNNRTDTIYLHWVYHPNDIPRHRIRAIYDSCCGEIIKEEVGIEKMIIAYSRPPNIKDTLTKAKLHQAPGKEASKYYSGELPR